MKKLIVLTRELPLNDNFIERLLADSVIEKHEEHYRLIRRDRFHVEDLEYLCCAIAQGFIEQLEDLRIKN